MIAPKGRKTRSVEYSVVAVPVWGPEPIGAAQVDSLLAINGAQLAGRTTFNAVGFKGDPDNTSYATFQPPQHFAGQRFTGMGVPIVEYPNGGLPDTHMPAGMTPFGAASA